LNILNIFENPCSGYFSSQAQIISPSRSHLQCNVSSPSAKPVDIWEIGVLTCLNSGKLGFWPVDLWKIASGYSNSPFLLAEKGPRKSGPLCPRLPMNQFAANKGQRWLYPSGNETRQWKIHEHPPFIDDFPIELTPPFRIDFSPAYSKF
jgi:hypothetical protein